MALPGRLEKELISAGLPPLYTAGSVEKIPDAPGAYALALHLANPVDLDLKSVAAERVRAGWHIYVGSARGPGGLRARLRRHFRKDKKVHWHIDRLTVTALEMCAAVTGDSIECELVARLLAAGGLTCETPGFGSSDCLTCPGHLLTLRTE